MAFKDLRQPSPRSSSDPATHAGLGRTAAVVAERARLSHEQALGSPGRCSGGDELGGLRSASDAGLTRLTLDDDVQTAVLDDVVGVRDHEHLTELPVGEL
jgi:hypothetical protein